MKTKKLSTLVLAGLCCMTLASGCGANGAADPAENSAGETQAGEEGKEGTESEKETVGEFSRRIRKGKHIRRKYLRSMT